MGGKKSIAGHSDCCYYPFEKPVPILLGWLHTTTVTITDAFHTAVHFALFICGYISGGGEVEYRQCSYGCPQITELEQATGQIWIKLGVVDWR
jgi:hypothetical protein